MKMGPTAHFPAWAAHFLSLPPEPRAEVLGASSFSFSLGVKFDCTFTPPPPSPPMLAWLDPRRLWKRRKRPSPPLASTTTSPPFSCILEGNGGKEAGTLVGSNEGMGGSA